MAAGIGAVVCILFTSFSQSIVSVLGVVPLLVPDAALYLAIRALASPAANAAVICSVRPGRSCNLLSIFTMLLAVLLFSKQNRNVFWII